MRRLLLFGFGAGVGLLLAPLTAVADDKPVEQPRVETQVDASKGGLTVRSGSNSLTFGAYVQVRGFLDERELYDADASGTDGHGEADDLAPSFDVTRVRLSIKGTVFEPWVRYNVAIEASRTPGESDSKVKDAYVELGVERISVRAGQYKVPFSLQSLVPDWGQQLVERSIAVAAFAPDRDTGVMVLGTAKAKKLGWSAGVFNGSGESRRQNNGAVLWAARVWADPLGEFKLSESAVEAPPKGVLHVGLAVRGGDAARGGRAGVFQEPDDQTAVGLELAWKRRRVFLAGEGFWQRDEVHNPTPGPAVESRGWQVQGGYMLVARRVELDARYAEVDPDHGTAGDGATELRGGVNYYWKGHNLKLQADAGRLTYEASAPGRANASRLPTAAGLEVTDYQVRVQLQLYF
jgi:phosphate-selective porin